MAELENAVLMEIRRLAVEELALDAPVTLADRLKEDLQLRRLPARAPLLVALDIPGAVKVS